MSSEIFNKSSDIQHLYSSIVYYLTESTISIHSLHRQQLQLSLLRAATVVFSVKGNLHQILSQHVNVDVNSQVYVQIHMQKVIYSYFYIKFGNFWRFFLSDLMSHSYFLYERLDPLYEICC